MQKIVNFLDIKISAVRANEIVDKILEYALTGKSRFMTYLNAHCVNISFTDFEYKKILQKADLVYAGGQSVVWASRFLGMPLPERVNIMDFFDKLVIGLKERGVTIYLLGENSYTVKKAAEELNKKGLKVLESRNGFFDEAGEREIIEEINALKPNILLVGMGVPKQEKWICSHLNQLLDVNLFWAVGGVFKILSGELKNAPKWISRSGLEWLYLGIQDPRRLWNRYLLGNPTFVNRVFKYKFNHL